MHRSNYMFTFFERLANVSCRAFAVDIVPSVSLKPRVVVKYTVVVLNNSPTAHRSMYVEYAGMFFIKTMQKYVVPKSLLREAL
jgi:hypothetical protein